MKDENTYHNLGGTNLPDYMRVTPFEVPEQFFTDQSEKIISQIRISNTSTKENPAVPHGYFDTLENNILARIAEETLKNQVTDAGFTVPLHYFEEFEENIQKQRDNDFLHHFAKTDGFSTPTAYFEELEENILITLQLNKMSTDSKGGLSIPDGYVELLSKNITSKIKITEDIKEDAPVIRIPSRPAWYKYVAAAAILFVSSAAYFFVEQQEEPNQKIALEQISNDEIVSYLAQVGDEETLMDLATFYQDSELNNETTLDLDKEVEDKEIEEYLNYML